MYVCLSPNGRSQSQSDEPAMTLLVGTVKGPGEKPNEFIFVTTDNDHTRIGEFIYYATRAGQKILGNVMERSLSRALPDSFLADPATPPAMKPDGSTQTPSTTTYQRKRS